MPTPPRRTVLATIAVASAIVAFFVSPISGLLLGILAVVTGAFAVLRAAASERSGAIAGVFGMLLGVAAIAVKILQGVLHLIF